MDALIQIFTNPGSVFEKQREDSSWLLPALVVVGFSIVSAIAVNLATDMEAATMATIDQQIAMMEQQGVPQAQIDQVVEQMESGVAMAQNPALLVGGALLSAVVVFIFTILFHALYFLIVGKTMGLEQGYSDWMALACWGRMPWVIGAVVLVIASVTMSAQGDPSAYNLLAFSNWVALPNQDSMFLGTFVKSLDILILWSIAIMTIGFQKWSDKSFGISLAVVAVPYVVVYGILLAV